MDNRLAFESELDEIVSISYTSTVVVVVSTRVDISSATGQVIADFTYLEPLDENSIRAFDVQSNSLLEVRLQYAAFPITVQ